MQLDGPDPVRVWRITSYSQPDNGVILRVEYEPIPSRGIGKCINLSLDHQITGQLTNILMSHNIGPLDPPDQHAEAETE